jgi:hypothetical protein
MKDNIEEKLEVGDKVVCDGLRTGKFGKVLGHGSSKHSIALNIDGDEIHEPDYCLLEVTEQNKRAVELLLSHLTTTRKEAFEEALAELPEVKPAKDGLVGISWNLCRSLMRERLLGKIK